MQFEDLYVAKCPTHKTKVIMHYDIKGQQWGVRRYQDENGSYTFLGKERRRASFGNLRNKEHVAEIASEYPVYTLGEIITKAAARTLLENDTDNNHKISDSLKRFNKHYKDIKEKEFVQEDRDDEDDYKNKQKTVDEHNDRITEENIEQDEKADNDRTGKNYKISDLANRVDKKYSDTDASRKEKASTSLKAGNKEESNSKNTISSIRKHVNAKRKEQIQKNKEKENAKWIKDQKDWLKNYYLHTYNLTGNRKKYMLNLIDDLNTPKEIMYVMSNIVK